MFDIFCLHINMGKSCLTQITELQTFFPPLPPPPISLTLISRFHRDCIQDQIGKLAKSEKVLVGQRKLGDGRTDLYSCKGQIGALGK